MRTLRMRIFAFALIIAVISFGVNALVINAAAEDYDIKVRLNGIANHTSDYVAFDYNPIMTNDRTYVHTRGFAEAAGMSVGWDQENHTTFLKIYANKDSEKPIEVYAAELFDTLSDRALGEPSSITVSLMLTNNNALVRYNYDIGGGNIAGYGRTVKMDGAAVLVNNAAMMIPLRAVAELFSLDVGWDQETQTADISIPETIATPDGLNVTDKWIPDGAYAGDMYAYADTYAEAYSESSSEEQSAVIDTASDSEHELGEYLGSFKITKYCPCNICNGGWGSYTAWAGEIIPGQTIGVNLNDIPKLAWVYIEGIGWRRAEDTGSGIGSKHIDLAVSSHYEATHGNVVYRDVWLAK